MNIWATDYIPRLIHWLLSGVIYSFFEVKECENGYFEKENAGTALHFMVQYLLFESTANYRVLLFMFPCSHRSFIMDCCWD